MLQTWAVIVKMESFPVRKFVQILHLTRFALSAVASQSSSELKPHSKATNQKNANQQSHTQHDWRQQHVRRALGDRSFILHLSMLIISCSQRSNLSNWSSKIAMRTLEMSWGCNNNICNFRIVRQTRQQNKLVKWVTCVSCTLRWKTYSLLFVEHACQQQ